MALIDGVFPGLAGVVLLGGCLGAEPVVESGASFIEEATFLDESPDAIEPDYVVQLELLPAREGTPWVPPEDPRQWEQFLADHPDFLAPDAAGTPGGAAAGALPEDDQQAQQQPPLTFRWREFLSRIGSNAGHKEGVVLASAGVLAIGIPVPDPTDAVGIPAAAIVFVVGSAVVLVSIPWDVVTDPAFGRQMAQMAESTVQGVHSMWLAITRALTRTYTRRVDEQSNCQERLALAGPVATARPGALVVCYQPPMGMSFPAVVNAPGGVVSVMNVGPDQVFLAGDIPAGLDVRSVARQQLNPGPGWILPGMARPHVVSPSGPRALFFVPRGGVPWLSGAVSITP